MKKIVIFLCLIRIDMAIAQSFSDYFEPSRMRVNLLLAGNTEQQFAYLESINEEPEWGGSQYSLIDKFNYGDYYLKIFSKDEKLIYSHGFSSLFQEWRYTSEARTIARAHTLSLTFPMPKNEVRLNIFERDKATNAWKLLLNLPINPADKQIRRGVSSYNFTVKSLIHNGNSSQKVDIAIIAEGYTKEEMDKFNRDATQLTDYLFSIEPFALHRNDFNIWLIESISEESGIDIPHRGIWKNTVADASFYTFGIDRYLTVPNHTKLCEIAWNVPYDAIYVLANTNLYGGGGIYNFYALCTSDNALSKNVFVHEFGHSFAGLADEYYTSTVVYENFYNLQTEPWEPNITTLVDFASKWQGLIIKDADTNIVDMAGLFEGGGYMAKGVYRPAYDCRMKSSTTESFCHVCRRAIERTIESYTK